ncbi:MAG: hypothetical protein E7031_04160 [Akkermansiaceae bacterium]|nr:hypothetical protein [Akkermansiaceae bacterium]
MHCKTPHITGIFLLSFICGDAYAHADTLNAGMTLISENKSAICFPCGQLDDGTPLEYAQMGDFLYILTPNTLYAYKIIPNSTTAWLGSYVIAKVAPHTGAFPLTIIEKNGHDEVKIHRQGITHRCEFKEMRGLNPGNVAKEYEAYKARTKRAEEVLQVYARSCEHSEP